MNRIDLIRHNIPHYPNKVLAKISINLNGKIRKDYRSNLRRLLGGGWDDPFGFGFKLMQIMNYNVLKKMGRINGKNEK